jgi:bleomycin hydrolase
MKLFIFLVISFFFGFYNPSFSQKSEPYQFTNIKILKTTPVKDQGKSNTCWCFSTISMLESELLQKGKGEYNLSEMFVVRHTFDNKAEKYVRMHGGISFSGGGEYNDVLDVIKSFGIVPAPFYTGLKPKEDKPDHLEMDKILKGYLDGLLKPEGTILSTVWFQGYNKVLDTYLGETPKNFSYEGKEYTPLTFAQSLDIHPEDYVLLSSYTHHPFYEKFSLEVPDNWSWGEYYNVPIDELISIIDQALASDYTVVWAADVSEKGFSFNKGIAIVPDISDASTTTEWNNAFTNAGPEKKITQKMRQDQFDNFSTTDDHGMQIVGLAKDQNGSKFYYVKNSWGTGNLYNGFMYVSEAYVRLKTMSIMVNKNCVPSEIKNKLKF